MQTDLTPMLPLSPAILHILLALAGEDRHGYGIIKEVVRQSQGRYRLGPGTLYDNLQKLLEQAIVDDVQSEGRRHYRLTRFGRSVLAAEVERLETIVREAKAYLHPARSGGVS
jgi:DNA-binding PadR family transcriptional regulator